MGLLTETPGLYERLSAGQNLALYARLYEVPDRGRTAGSTKSCGCFGLWPRRAEPAGRLQQGHEAETGDRPGAAARTIGRSSWTSRRPGSTRRRPTSFARRSSNLKAAGRTIFLCTHNLDEAERLCDRVAFLRGEVLRVDSPARLRTAGAGSTLEVTLGASPGTGLLDTLRARSEVRSVESDGEHLTVRVGDARQDTPDLVRLLASQADVLAVTSAAASMEAVYFEVMGLRPPTDEVR